MEKVIKNMGVLIKNMGVKQSFEKKTENAPVFLLKGLL